MRSHDRAPLPPAVAGTTSAGAELTVTLLRWLRTGFQTLAADRDKPLRVRCSNGALIALWWAMWPLLYVVQRANLSRRHTRYYLSNDHTAILAITARPGAWHIDDHVACQVGGRYGFALRSVLVPALIEHADHAGVAITATTATRTLADRYSKDVPGLEDVGRHFPRGRKLRRTPKQLPARGAPTQAPELGA